MKKNVKSYIVCIIGLIVLIMIALSLPSMIFSIQDGYLTATVETETREPYDTETAEEAYPKDIAIRMSRVAQTRWGNMAVSVENMYIGQELFQTLMAEIMSQDYMTILLSVENYGLTEALERISVENLKVCDRYVVYGEDYTEGILLTFWYMKIYLPSVESYIEFIVDSETYSIYYAEVNAEEELNYVYILETENEAPAHVIVNENIADDKEYKEVAAMVSDMAETIPKYYAEYYLQYYGVDTEALLDSKEEKVSITSDFVTTTYTLPYGRDNNLLFRFYAEHADGKITNVSIGLPLIRQLVEN